MTGRLDLSLSALDTHVVYFHSFPSAFQMEFCCYSSIPAKIFKFNGSAWKFWKSKRYSEADIQLSLPSLARFLSLRPVLCLPVCSQMELQTCSLQALLHNAFFVLFEIIFFPIGIAKKIVKNFCLFFLLTHDIYNRIQVVLFPFDSSSEIEKEYFLGLVRYFILAALKPRKESGCYIVFNCDNPEHLDISGEHSMPCFDFEQAHKMTMKTTNSEKMQ